MKPTATKTAGIENSRHPTAGSGQPAPTTAGREEAGTQQPAAAKTAGRENSRQR